MEYVRIICQVIIALGIINVWIVRYGKQTDWRAEGAQNMKEEFKAYGLPVWFMYVIGFLKMLFAALLIIGIWVEEVVNPAAIGMAILMIGAIAMHIKVHDPIKRAFPAFIMLLLSVIVIIL